MKLPNWLRRRRATPTPTPTMAAYDEADRNAARIRDAYDELLAGLDRVEQILREMGYCDDCSEAHLRGVRECRHLRIAE